MLHRRGRRNNIFSLALVRKTVKLLLSEPLGMGQYSRNNGFPVTTRLEIQY
jgi:hypothetical protein